MNKLVVGVADDQQAIHDILDNYCADEQTIELIHFYYTGDVEDYLYDKPDSLDMLFLDIVFEGSTSGTDALPSIKELSPSLPVILLTGNDKDNPEVDILIKNKLAVSYLEKPISKKVFLNTINSTKIRRDEVAELKKELDGNEEVLDEIQNEYNQKLEEAYVQMGQREYQLQIDRVSVEDRCAEIVARNIPDTIRLMFKRNYNNMEFRDKALIELCGKHFDERIFKLLKILNDNLPIPNGVNKQLFREFGVLNLYEYRISQKARLFIQHRDGLPLYVYDVDYNHDKHD